MALQTLEIKDFRCIEHAKLELDPKCTLIAGPNASGKTSVLEAIYVMSCGHSFRTNRRELLIRSAAETFLTVGQVIKGNSLITIGVSGSKLKTEARIGGDAVAGFAELAQVFPARVIDPEVHRLLEEGPAERRQFIDWGVFHVEPTFVQIWRRYQRALRQRNASLKSKLPISIINSWNADLIESGEIISQQRIRYIEAVQGYVSVMAMALLKMQVTIEYQRGWRDDLDLEKALARAMEKDQRYAATTVGPHRADLVVKIEGSLAKERISRGQQKLLAAALLLSQVKHRFEFGNDAACLLVDDPAAELDVDNLRVLLEVIAEIPAQLVITALDLSVINKHLKGTKFHVEHGRIGMML